MTRRLLRYAANGLYLLSLLAAAAAAWLWWHARPGKPDSVDVATGRRLIRVTSYRSGVSLSVVGDWDSARGVWARSNAAPADPHEAGFVFYPAGQPWRPWRWGLWEGYVGTVRTFVRPSGRVERVTYPDADAVILWPVDAGDVGGMYGRGSKPLDEWGIESVPHWHVLLATAAAPAAWAALRGRRAWRRRRRARAGHCGRCGYDLRATPDPAGPRLPRCPECGAAAAAE